MATSVRVREARAICVNYVAESGLNRNYNDPNNQPWVPGTLRKKTADYALLWHQALPIRGIIIGKSPSPYMENPDVAPEYAAAFAYDESLCRRATTYEPPASADTMAHEIGLCCEVEAADVLIAIRDCWQLKDKGVISVNALPLGREGKKRTTQNLTIRDNEQMNVLAETLSKLLHLGAGTESSGSTTVVALGNEAQICAQLLKKLFEAQSPANWTLHIHELYHPARTSWVYRRRQLPFLTMAKGRSSGESELGALCSLLGRGFHFRPKLSPGAHSSLPLELSSSSSSGSSSTLNDSDDSSDDLSSALGSLTVSRS